jgi:hypothetical protein
MSKGQHLREHLAACRHRNHAMVEAAKAAKAALPKDSFWLCPPDQFYEEAHKRAVEMQALTVSYVKPWGVV